MVLSVLKMLFGRRKTIFHVEEALPDPEEVKFRFRRRIMLFSLVGALGVLSIPVWKEVNESLQLKRELREVSEYFLESKKIAIQNRKPVLVKLSSEGKVWTRTFSAQAGICSPDKTLPQQELQTDFTWNVNLKNSLGEIVEENSFCFDPVKGILVGSNALGESQLLLSANSSQGGEKSAYILISKFGDEIQYTDDL